MALRSVTVKPAFDVGSTTQMTMTVPFPKFGILKRVRIPATAGDTSATILIRDNGDITNGLALLNVAAVNITTAYDKSLVFRGVSSADLLTASVTGEAIARGPLKARITLAAGTTAPGFMQFIFEDPKYKETNFKTRGTGAQTATTSFVNLGADFAVVKRMRFKSSADTTVAVTVTDAYGYAVAANASADYTTQQDKVLIDVATVNDAGAVVASAVEHGVVARSPLKVVLSGLGSGSFRTDFIVEA
jgi:hypothetical protein